MVSAKRSVSSRRVITAATGWPLPIGLPSVTTSAATPCAAKDHRSLAGAAVAGLHLVGDVERARVVRPVRERRGRLGAGGVRIPSDVKPPSTKAAAGRTPALAEPLRGPRELRPAVSEVASRYRSAGANVATWPGLPVARHSSGEIAAIASVTPW